jgi:DNA polymerase-3 subunit beta
MLNAYKNGIISEERMTEALTRIIGLKAKMGLHKMDRDAMVPGPEALMGLGAQERKDMQKAIAEDAITFVSTDTHKLVRYINNECHPGIVSSFTMPAKPASILRSILNKDIENVEITMDSKSATFKFDSYSLSCKFINGNYPNYNRVIPQNSPFELTIDRVSFLNAMRRVALFASTASDLVKVNIQSNDVHLSSQDLDFSTAAEERITCE